MTEWIAAKDCSGRGCVEVMHAHGYVGVRDSLNPVKVLAFPVEEWAAFLTGVKAGEFDRPAAEEPS